MKSHPQADVLILQFTQFGLKRQNLFTFSILGVPWKMKRPWQIIHKELDAFQNQFNFSFALSLELIFIIHAGRMSLFLFLLQFVMAGTKSWTVVSERKIVHLQLLVESLEDNQLFLHCGIIS